MLGKKAKGLYDRVKLKPSLVDWIGDIPEEWRVVKIRYLTLVKRGASPRPIDDTRYFDDNGKYSWVRITDVSASLKYLEFTTQKLSDLGSSLSVKLEPGKLFLSIAGSVGKPIITKIRCCIHDGFVYFPYLKHSSEYLYYIFLSVKPFGGLGKLGTQLNLNTDIVGDIKIPLPSIDEQRQIADFLDKHTALVDQLISKKEQQIELLKEKRQALITRAVTKGLDDKVKLKPSGIDWIGDIPEHWVTRRMKYLCEISTGDKDTVNAVVDGEYPFFVRSQTVKRINTYTRDCEGILIAGDGDVGKVFHYIIGRFDFHQRVYLLNNFRSIQGKYLFFYLRENFYKVALDGNAKTTVDSLRRPIFQNFHITIPPLNEQRQIAAFLDKETSSIDLLEQKIKRSIDLLKEYRSSLITNAVLGRIDINNDRY